MRFQRNLAVFAALSLLSACGGMDPIPEDHFHRIMVTGAASVGRLADTLLVERFAASSLHQQRPLVYVDEGGESLGQYRYHLWEESPERMLQLAMADYLRESGIARAITVNTDVPADWEIRTVIRRFELVGEGDAQRAVVALVIQLAANGPTELRLVRDYAADAAVARSGTDAAVDALTTATAEVFQRFASDLGRELAQTR